MSELGNIVEINIVILINMTINVMLMQNHINLYCNELCFYN